MDYFKSSVFGSLIALFLGLGSQAQALPSQISSIAWSPEVIVALPQPLSFGAVFSCEGSSALCSKAWNYYSNVGFFRWPLAISERSFAEWSAEVGVRYAPFSFPLFFSMGVGYRYLSVSAQMASFTIEGETLASSGSLNFSTPFLAPSVGWNFTLSRNLVLGLDLGIQVPFLSSGTLYLEDAKTGTNSDTSEVLKTNSSLQMGRIASLLIPKFTLVRLTWYFDRPLEH